CFQLPVALYKFWAGAETEEERREILGGTMLLTIVLPTLLLFPVYVWADYFSVLLGMPSHANLLRLVLVECQLGMIVTVVMTEMRARDESRRFSLWELFQRVGIGLLSILLVAGFGMGVWGMFIAQTAIFAVITLWLLPPFLKQIGLCFNGPLMKQMFHYALPLVPSAVAMAAVHSADRFFLQHMVGLEATGLYAIGYKFGMLVNILVLGPFLLIWQPKRFTIANEEDAEEKYGKIFTWLLVLSSFVALALTGLSRETVQIMTASPYWESYTLVPLIAWSYVFFALSTVVNVGLFVHHKTGTISWLVFVAFVANILGNIVLIPRYGSHGAAVSTLISFVLLFILNLAYSRHLIAISFEWRRIFQLTALVSAAWGVMVILPHVSLLVDILSKLFVLLFFVFMLFFLGFFEQLRIAERVAGAWSEVRERIRVAD
ncbi:MAG: polysaccharide biosynthesis C-terminal domain-containing protein, partial [Thermodesulfobacteriota bacterium]